MNQDQVALLLAALAATYFITALIGKFTGDARRDVALMGAAGFLLGAMAGLLQLLPAA